MTKSWSLFKALSWPRFKRANLFIGIEILAVLVSTVWTAFTSDFSAATPFFSLMGWSFLVPLAAVVMMAVANERTLTANTYRLLPISDWKLYLLNLASSLVNIIYISLIQVVLYGVTFLIGISRLGEIFEGFPEGLADLSHEVNLWQIGFSSLVVSLLIVILIWSTITLVHLVTNAASSFLPKFRQGFVNVVIYVVVILIAVRLVSMLIGAVSYLSTQMLSNGVIGSIWLGALVMLIVIVVEGVINAWVLGKWVESSTN